MGLCIVWWIILSFDPSPQSDFDVYASYNISAQELPTYFATKLLQADALVL